MAYLSKQKWIKNAMMIFKTFLLEFNRYISACYLLVKEPLKNIIYMVWSCAKVFLNIPTISNHTLKKNLQSEDKR